MWTAVTWGPTAAATEHTQRAARQPAPVSWIPQWTVISGTGFDVVPEPRSLITTGIKEVGFIKLSQKIPSINLTAWVSKVRN